LELLKGSRASRSNGRVVLVVDSGEIETMRETQSKFTNIDTMRTWEVHLGDVGRGEDVVDGKVLCLSLEEEEEGGMS
jgi:hypothetical protein